MLCLAREKLTHLPYPPSVAQIILQPFHKITEWLDWKVLKDNAVPMFPNLSAFTPFSPQPVFGIAIGPVQDLVLGLVELHEVCTDPHLQPAQLPLDPSLPSSMRLHHSAWCRQ